MCALLCLQDLKTIAQLSKYGTKKLIKSKLHTEGLSETCPSRAHRCTSETSNIKLNWWMTCCSQGDSPNWRKASSTRVFEKEDLKNYRSLSLTSRCSPNILVTFPQSDHQQTQNAQDAPVLRPLEGQGFLPVPLEKWPWHKGREDTSLLRSPLTVLAACLSIALPIAPLTENSPKTIQCQQVMQPTCYNAASRYQSPPSANGHEVLLMAWDALQTLYRKMKTHSIFFFLLELTHTSL